jgi:hypothetical protein
LKLLWVASQFWGPLPWMMLSTWPGSTASSLHPTRVSTGLQSRDGSKGGLSQPAVMGLLGLVWLHASVLHVTHETRTQGQALCPPYSVPLPLRAESPGLGCPRGVCCPLLRHAPPGCGLCAPCTHSQGRPALRELPGQCRDHGGAYVWCNCWLGRGGSSLELGPQVCSCC